MMTPCEVLCKEVFPKVKVDVAKQLVNKGFSQQIIAEKLGISQAMVSKYILKEDKPSSLVSAFSKVISELIVDDIPKEQFVNTICELCFTIRERGTFCGLCFKNCKSCIKIRSKGNKRQEVINDIKKAVKLLERYNLVFLMPEVRMNICMAVPDAKTKYEIAAIPGRLVKIKARIRALTEPEFGASNHLAKVLLMAMKVDKDIRAVSNIKYDNKIRLRLNKLKFRYSKFDRKRHKHINLVMKQGLDCIIDIGAFGIEPCVYIFGSNAIDVVKKIIKIGEVKC